MYVLRRSCRINEERNPIMSHEVETMAFANEVPWHGLGNRVDPKVSVDEMLIAAGLNWKVELFPMFVHKKGKSIATSKAALIRDLDDKVLTVASPNWKPTQNREVLEFFRDWTDAGKATLETAGSLRGGKIVWALANIGAGFVTNNGRDGVKGYVLLAFHHEMGKANSARVTKVRVVCANTMAAAMGSAAQGLYKQNHLTNFDFNAARETVEAAREDLRISEINARALESLQMSEYDTVRALAKHFQAKPDGITEEEHVKKIAADAEYRNQGMHEVLLSLAKAPGATPGNAWGVLNAVTYWADHISGRSADARLNKAWFGDNAKLKSEVEKDLLLLTV